MDQKKTCKYIVSLIRSLLENVQPPVKPEDVSFEDIYMMAKKHHVRNMCFFAIEKLDEKPDQGLYEKWKQYVSVSEAQSAVQLSERDAVITALQNAEIDCLPLKGYYLKEMYPKPEFREMADLDILIRPQMENSVIPVMAENGYSVQEDNEMSAHRVFNKPPFMTVEIHRRLFNDIFFESNKLSVESLPLASDPWNSVHKTEKPYVYAFSAEDSYVFLILHLAKHYYGSGTGIRQFVDIWVYRQKNKLDQSYVYQTLRGTRMEKFCRDAEKLVDAWFSDEVLTPELAEMEDYIFSCGVYGSFANQVTNKVKEFQGDSTNRFLSARYAWYRTFPPLSYMKKYYPYLRQREYLLPAAWVQRLFIKIFSKDSPAIRELRTFMKIQDKLKK